MCKLHSADQGGYSRCPRVILPPEKKNSSRSRIAAHAVAVCTHQAEHVPRLVQPARQTQRPAQDRHLDRPHLSAVHLAPTGVRTEPLHCSLGGLHCCVKAEGALESCRCQFRRSRAQSHPAPLRALSPTKAFDVEPKQPEGRARAQQGGRVGAALQHLRSVLRTGSASG